MVFISKDKLAELKRKEYNRGKEFGSTTTKSENKALISRNKVLEEAVENVTAELKALKGTRQNIRDIRKTELAVQIREDDVEIKEKLLNAKAKRLEARIKDLESDGDEKYQSGYADGVADGLRKVTEMTEQDRNNMTKIAMVSAARGSSASEVQGVTDVLQLSERNEDKKTSKS